MAFVQEEMPDADLVPEGQRQRITARSVVLGLVAAVAVSYYASIVEILRLASVVKSSFPIAVILGFLVWVVINMVLARVAPRAMLSRTEMMVIFAMMWVVSTMPGVGWTGYFIGSLPAPHFFATPENRWAELFMEDLPQWGFLEAHEGLIDRFYFGLRKGESVPWMGWAMPVFWWFSGAIAFMGGGFFVAAIFHRQWADAERLTYPLVNFPMDLMQGFDEGKALPKVFRDPIFWAGFAWTAGIIFWNVIHFWFPNVPRITLFDSAATKAMDVARNFPPIYLRVLPLVIGLGYLCSLDLLFSLWFFGLLSVVKVGVMNRTGFTVGLPGQPSKGGEIITLESHGAMTVLVLWSIWIARRHLRHVWRTAWEGGRSESAVSYRFALVGLAACVCYLCGFFMALGMTFPLAVSHLALMFIGYFAASKFIAATGFGYLFPVWIKGGGFLKTVMGTATMSSKNLTTLELVNSSVFYGGASRLQTMQVLPHHLKAMDGVQKGRRWTGGTMFLAFAAGFMVCTGLLIYFCYRDSLLYLRSWVLWKGSEILLNGIAVSLGESQKTMFDLQKLSVWLVGAGEAGLMAALRTWFPWWPLHPLGLAFQYTTGPRLYALSILMVWAAKLLIVRFGGPRLYERAKPFFYGTVVGYCVGVGAGAVIDWIWFPGSSHGFHNF